MKAFDRMPSHIVAADGWNAETGARSDMTARENETARLRLARHQIAAKQTSEARVLLDQLQADLSEKSVQWLGPLTTLGLPRKLHSAYLKLAKAEGDVIARIGLQYNLVPLAERIEKHFHIDDAARRHMATFNAQMVPRVIHQIWIGAKPVPPTVSAWQRHAAATGYGYRLWREDDIRAIGVFDDPVFKAFLDAGDYPGAVDVARYLILALEGGVYLDCDWYPARMDTGFDTYLPMVGLSALAEPTPRNLGGESLLLTNSLIAAPPGHLLFRHLVDALPAVMAELPGAPAWWATGPVIFTLLARMTAVTIPDTAFVAANLPVNATMADALDAARKAEAARSGFLIAWKCW